MQLIRTLIDCTTFSLHSFYHTRKNYSNVDKCVCGWESLNMKQIECLNLCELIEVVSLSRQSLEDEIKKIIHECGHTDCRRIYIGSYFCGQYFIRMKEAVIEAVSQFCIRESMGITLVIPMFSEKDLVAGKNKVESVLSKCTALDEITVNDYGMLKYTNQHYKKIINSSSDGSVNEMEPSPVGVNMGRLFMKDTRDRRYEEYWEKKFQPGFFTKYMGALIEQYGVTGIEFDPTHRQLDFSGVEEIASIFGKIQVGLHMPYCYLTVGQVCEIGSIHTPMEKKFRPNGSCGQECLTHRYELKVDEDTCWLHVGRAIYDKIPECRVNGLMEYRIIYSPIDVIPMEVEE